MDPATVVLTPLVVDCGADPEFRPLIGALSPTDRVALSAATVLLAASPEHKQVG